ncbi:MAG TPA: ribosome maturation factor RimM [Methylotenera sp.]|nr:ribosome maturation factor RimM [Methylotenera sp.]HPH05394.1 ribosome maturation factor RimM [Methylotenera sp.]HPN01320.1 ribosome maturation factor RimM [Methylotenera sp.]
MVVMGRVVAPYGVLGWLKVLPDTETIDGLFDYDTWWLGKANDWRELEVEAAKVHNDVLVVKLKGINDRDAAFACKGQQIAVPRDALPEPEQNAYYWSDLIGLQVTNKQDIDFGVITEVFETGANDVFVVKPEDAKDKSQERLLPFIASVVLEVDVKAKTMLVDWDAEF